MTNLQRFFMLTLASSISLAWGNQADLTTHDAISLKPHHNRIATWKRMHCVETNCRSLMRLPRPLKKEAHKQPFFLKGELHS